MTPFRPNSLVGEQTRPPFRPPQRAPSFTSPSGPTQGPSQGPGQGSPGSQGYPPQNQAYQRPQQIQGQYPSQGQFQAPSPGQGQFRAPVPNQAQFQPPVPNQAQFQPPVPNQAQFQPPVPNQAQFQPPVPNQGQFQPPVPNQAQFQPPLPSQAQFQPPMPNQGSQGQFQPPIPNQAQYQQPQGQFQQPPVPGPAPMSGMMASAYQNQGGAPSNNLPTGGMAGMPNQFQQPAFQQGDQYGYQQGQQQGYAPVNQMTQNFANMGVTNRVPIQLVHLGQSAPLCEGFTLPPVTPNILQSSVTLAPTSNADPCYKRCTLTAIPQSPAILNKLRLPFGLLITPYRQLLEGEEPVPVISAPQIVRCRRCRTYINPWVTFVEQGTRWKCNMCFLSNEVPSFFDWDADSRVRLDRNLRPELTHGVVEYVAPAEYMVRPPQPVVLMFVIDVSCSAMQSGMVHVAAKAILDSLDRIPNDDGRTKVSIISFDSSVHFYNLASHLSEPQMLVTGDLDEPFLPVPYDLIVSLAECRSLIDILLTRLPDMHIQNQNTNNALGKVLKFAQKLIAPIGGKIIVLQHALPDTNDGSLKMREDPKLFGTAKESTLLQAAGSFYKNFAVDCSPSQVSIDVFLFNPQYADVATLSGCAKFTGGTLFYYPSFSGARTEDAIKFGTELGHLLTRPLGLEAVMRVRASKGIKMTSFHGNFFLRSSDLLSLPNVSPDNSYAIEMTIIEELVGTIACFQTALLHTSANGERRIRVLTLAVPVTASMVEIFSGIDQFGVAALLMKKAVERAVSAKIEDAREAVSFKLAELIAVHKHAIAGSAGGGQLGVVENLRLLPVLVLGMLKNLALRNSTTVPSDLRSYMIANFAIFCPEMCILNLYPRFWALHSLASDESLGTLKDGKLAFPVQMNLSSEKLDRSGLYLLDNGLEMFIWVGKSVDLGICEAIFGVGNPNSGKAMLPLLENSLNRRVHSLLNKIRDDRLRTATLYPHLYIVKEEGDPGLRLWFLSQLVEDRFEQLHSYPQFVSHLRDAVGGISI